MFILSKLIFTDLDLFQIKIFTESNKAHSTLILRNIVIYSYPDTLLKLTVVYLLSIPEFIYDGLVFCYGGLERFVESVQDGLLLAGKPVGIVYTLTPK